MLATRTLDNPSAGVTRDWRPAGVNPVTIEVVRNAVNAYADEMATALCKSAYNMMIYEVRDFCCGLIDTQARMISQNKGGLPIFLADLGIAVQDGIERCRRVPGRMERVEANGVSALVDYAHTDDALRRALETARAVSRGRVIVVFGCGGDRDKGKRPIMGRIAVEKADMVIVTDDNPRTEEPARIRAEILAGARGALEIGDRQGAIRTAVLAKDDCFQNASMIRFRTNAHRKQIASATATAHHSQPNEGLRFPNSRRFQSSYLKSSGSSRPVPS